MPLHAVAGKHEDGHERTEEAPRAAALAAAVHSRHDGMI